ncbi:hypothetical protein H6P81_008621 [Aristolochia fimbriata]|uniref:Uncharacterized protein n=1 Tax=Aristolochia fimbriata TaxID=158543 RepID=A0AAV7EJT7_ARIFI|nr:hypothetical protein H6P81_008621 [Aristolochia fimbriata]
MASCGCSGCLGKKAVVLHGTHGGDEAPTTKEVAWMCDVCEWAPATLTCKADGAALCCACDADVHSAASPYNYASRHRRLPILLPTSGHGRHQYFSAQPDHFSSSLALPPPKYFNTTTTTTTNTTTTQQQQHHHHRPYLSDHDDQKLNYDHLLPAVKDFWSSNDETPQENNFQLDNMGLGRPKAAHEYPTFSTTTPLLNYMHSVCFPCNGGSISSSESVKANRTRSVEYCLSQGNTTTSCFTSVEREAKILKYREKRTKRNYGKTVRYWTRKADAETRPRIGGRFARVPDHNKTT